MPFKQPRIVLEGVYAFSPNRATLGGTSYLVLGKDDNGNSENILVDAPAHNPDILAFIAAKGGVSRWVITHRDGMGEAKALQASLQCAVIVQEQEAYLLPEIPNLITYRSVYQWNQAYQVIWTPGYSPGSSCLYCRQQGGILFTGRHLLVDHQGHLMPLKLAKTFHWPRQLRSVETLKNKFSLEPLAFICPAANTGFLRGENTLAEAYTHLAAIDLSQLINQTVA